VVSSLGQKQTVNFTLKLLQSQQAIEVSGEAPLINPGNANTSPRLWMPRRWRICRIRAAI
jgi:hypothetical protein